MLILLVQQTVVPLPDQIIQSNPVADENVAAEAGIGHDLNGFVVESVTAHASRDDLLAKDDVGQVQRGGLFKNAHDDQSAPRARQPACHEDGRWQPGALYDYIESFAAGDFQCPLQGILAAGVYDCVSAAKPRGLDAPLGNRSEERRVGK